jgi:hypothetical protein
MYEDIQKCDKNCGNIIPVTYTCRVIDICDKFTNMPL